MNSLKQPLLNGECSNKVKGCDTVTPYTNAGVFQILTYAWVTPLLALGHKKTIGVNDIPQLNSVNSVFQASPVLRNKLGLDHDDVGNVTEFSLAKALFLSAREEILWTGILAVLYTVAKYVCPFLLDSFVDCLNGTEKFKNQGYLLALTFVVATLTESLTRRHWMFKLQQVGLRLRASTTAMIYSKSLKLSSQSKQGQTSGELINLVAVDVDRFNGFMLYLHDTWLVILQVILGLLILYKNLGGGSFAALGAIVVIMFSNTAIGKWQEKFQGGLMESKDNRMKMTSETLRNMRILKLQGWEMSFLSKIFDLRKMESIWLIKYLYNSALMSFVFGISTLAVASVTFGTCMLLGIPLETGKILSAIATLRVLQGPIYSLPDTISTLIQLKVSLGRIANFLSLDELQVDSVEKLSIGSSDKAIEIINGNFSWVMDSPAPTLKSINVSVAHGMRVGVCGTVGSGKSSLLASILGEIPMISGAVKLCGSKAYVAQTPWIKSGTIQDNILLGKELSSERYEKVLEVCTLKRDLEILPFGDQTVIGERGINLSGGQKQRIQIARAVYHDADIYLFDDPFSAVDAHTGSHLFQEVFLGLLGEKTVVYVTHQIEFLNGADVILVMKDGSIAQEGKYDDILLAGSDFTELVSTGNSALSALDTRRAGKTSATEAADNDIINGKMQQGDKPVQNGKAEVGTSLPSAQLIHEEERETGSVGFSVYWKYITTAYAGSLAILTLVCIIMNEILHIGANYWLAWASPLSKDVKPVVSGSTLVIVYVSLAIGISLLTLVVDLLVATVGFATANRLFEKMHQCIFRAPMSFFDATPTGRIISRCSTDQSSAEYQIPGPLEGFASNTFQLMGILAVMSMVAWQVLFICIPVVFCSIWYQLFYIPSARELSRLAGVCEAPVIQFFAETISGTTTIRSFDLQSSFQETYMKILDTFSRPVFYVAASLKWLLLRLDFFSSMTFASLLFLLVAFAERINPAIAGVAVTYGLTLNSALVGIVWCLCHCETKMISVERILQYISIPSEAPLIIQTNRPDPSWPSCGEICFTNLQVRYAPHMPLVLHGITCTLPGKMKTGIVGRTGSGKSTLIQALFRIVEPTNGQISIDGVDTSKIGLQDLRSKLGIIPQDPIMFQGTIRSNLDPLEQFTDVQIWETLDKCQLGDAVRKMDKRLDSDVTENGENWSMGQRQLICLGRVLLKKSKVLVFDEATASVDTATDNLIQQTLKHHFSDCTIITIAHRMTSVLDSDMVLLLNNGLVKEFDSPARLLKNKSTSFAQLVGAWSTAHSM